MKEIDCRDFGRGVPLPGGVAQANEWIAKHPGKIEVINIETLAGTNAGVRVWFYVEE